MKNQDSNIRVLRTKKILRIFAYTFSVGWFFGAIYNLLTYNYTNNDDKIWAWLGIPVSAIFFISALRYKVIFSPEYITKYAFKVVTIYFDKIDAIVIGREGFTLRSEKKKLSITYDLEDYKEVVKVVTDKIRNKQNVKITGQDDILEQLNLQKSK